MSKLAVLLALLLLFEMGTTVSNNNKKEKDISRIITYDEIPLKNNELKKLTETGVEKLHAPKDFDLDSSEIEDSFDIYDWQEEASRNKSMKLALNDPKILDIQSFNEWCLHKEHKNLKRAHRKEKIIQQSSMLDIPKFEISKSRPVCIVHQSHLEWHKRFPLNGLKNSGTVCYMNVCMQTLFHIPEFVALVQSLQSNNNNHIAYAQKMIRAVFDQNSLIHSISLWEFQALFDATEHGACFKNNALNDAIEYMYKYLEYQEENFNFSIEQMQIIESLLYQKTYEVDICQNSCKIGARKQEEKKNLFLHVTIKDNANFIDLKQEISSMFSPQLIVNSHPCTDCGGNLTIRTTVMSSAPKYLFVELGKYKFDTTQKQIVWNGIPTTIPAQLQFPMATGSQISYSLKTVIHFTGSHYFVDIKDEEKNIWMYFDDTKVHETYYDIIGKHTAYGFVFVREQ